MQKAVDLRVGGQVADADAPAGQRVAAVPADGEHGLGRQTVRRAGRFDRHTDALLAQRLLEPRALDAGHADIDDMRHGMRGAVDAHKAVLLQARQQAVVQPLYMGVAGFLPGQCFGQCGVQADGKTQRRCAAAVDRGAGTAGDLRLNDEATALVQCADAVGTVEFVGSEAHRIDAVKPEVGLADGLGGVHVQAAAGVRLDDSGNLPNGLDRAKLTVHSADGDQDRIVAHQLPQLVQVYPAVAANVQQVDLIPLLLQSRQRRAHRGVLELGGDDVLADVPRRVRNALEGEVVRLACARGVDDLGGLHAKVLRNGLGHPLHLGAGLLPGNVGGVGVGDITALRRKVCVQNVGVCRGVGSIVKIDHAGASL